MSAPELREYLRVLSVEDDPFAGEVIRRVLERDDFEVLIQRVQSAVELDRALDMGSWDVVLSDHSMPGFSSTDALRLIKKRGLELPFIVVSGYIGEEAAVAVMREGAYDCVPKAGLDRLGAAVRQALGEAKERAALRRRERDLEALHAVAFAAGTTVDSERLADIATVRARELLHADTALLTWWDANAGVLRSLARSGTARHELLPAPDVIPLGKGLSGIVFDRCEALVVDDYERWPQRIRQPSRHRSAMAVPLSVGERVVGTLFVGSAKRRRFTPEDVRALSVLGAEVAPAIEASRLLADAQRAAYFDALTGMPNRALFARRLAERIGEAREDRTSFAILYADLDDFREVNDAFGHDAGDAVLCEFGQRFRGFGGLAGAAARFGADEFVMCLPNGSGQADARAMAERAPEFFSEPFRVGDQLVHITASIGIVVYPDHGRDAEGLLRHAEVAMRAAKRSQTRYAVYGPSLDPQSHRRITVASELRRALRGGELVLFYQPQVEMRSGATVAVEALLRWHHPVRGLVPPLEFIPVAEQTGLIIELTPWVIERALAQLAAWRDGGLALRGSVNVSMRNLRDPRFLEALARLISDPPLPADTLVLEITEGTIMLEAERTLDVLRRIRAMGIGIAIDDFGTGYSSLSYLSKLPIDELKIDKSFVMALENAPNRAIVRSVIQLSDAVGLRVVAEGVKDEATWDAVRDMGCQIAQGFHLSPPIPPDELAAWVGAR